MKFKIVTIGAVFFLSLVSGVFAQKILSDGSVTYNISVEKGKDKPGVGDAFDGATLTVQFKGVQVRSDLNSRLRQQTVFFNSKTGNAVILKESGAEKYMTTLTPSQWQQYNRKFAGAAFKNTTDTKTIQGYSCAMAKATLNDGSQVTVYYATDIKPIAQGYEYMFADLPGLPLEYTISSGGYDLMYSAASIQLTPVNASRFDLPTTGYKVLQFQQ